MKRKLIIVTLILTCGLSGAYLVQDYITTKEALKISTELNEKLNDKQEVIEEKLCEIATELENVKQENEEMSKNNNDLKIELENTKKVAEEYFRNLSSFNELSNTEFHEYYNLNHKIEITPKMLHKALAGTGLSGLEEDFLLAQQEQDVNVIFLVSIAVLESGWGTSDFGRMRNNLFGFGSYDNDTNATVYFNDRKEGIKKVAIALRRDYLNENGKYYNGAYPKGVGVKYCSEETWSSDISIIMNDIRDRITK